ncbi:putative alpha-L-fucosidase 1 isoform X2 [Cryptomeria japonica]|uniref:putative alpha-L-fucosidase 1 isoform X2 n=1 Tax=Cryptomeria japonica TaxID=3369 RepID=UPI0025AC248C|nr:putative alpha-L-fucosidase 1 isoform X2 [Cryptomeria japonica]
MESVSVLLILLTAWSARATNTPPPLPVLPLPSAQQLKWQLGGMAMFFHFGINTFTDSEWGTGQADPSLFNPGYLDARQWVRVAKEAGFRRVILTAKHHDGFCLWPSAYTNYSVKSSTWKGGNGDVVAELAAAAREAGIGLGLYLSPWDRHEACYGDTLRYNQHYLAQMRELLTRYSRQGDPDGSNWVPPECDVSIRPGWFWHGSQQPKTATSLLEIFYKSTGRNCMLLLNVPPNSTGLLAYEDVQVLHNFKDILNSIFSVNLAQNAIITASSVRGNDFQFGASWILVDDIFTYWAPDEGQEKWHLHIDLRRVISFNVLCLQEAIQLGQRVSRYHLDVLEDGVWCTVMNGSTVGYKKLERFSPVSSQFLRLTIDEARADPLIAFFGLYMDNTSIVYANDSSKAISISGGTLTKINLTTLDGKIQSVSGNLSMNSVLTS